MENLDEDRSIAKIDYLILHGLGKDEGKITYYRQVMSDPKKANQNAFLREYVSDVLDELLDIVFSDSIIYNRLRLVLEKEHNDKKRKVSESELLTKIKKVLRDVRKT